MINPASIRLAPRIARLAERLFGRSSRTSDPLILPARALPEPYYLESFGSGVAYPVRHPWNRVIRPIYGSGTSTTGYVNVAVPAHLRFRFNEKLRLPSQLPSVSVRPVSHRTYGVRRNFGTKLRLPGHARPTHVAYARRDRRLESNRRRHDQKVRGGVRRYYAFVRRVVGPVSEWKEAHDTIAANLHDPAAMMTALAINEAVDYAYGKRGQWIQRHIHEKPWYRLPVGVQTITNRMF